MRTFYCPAHGVTLIEDGQGGRKIILPQVGMSNRSIPNDCALLTCRRPQAGKLIRLDTNGFNTGQFCDVVEQ